ncbi:MAG: TM2 domain-containing protein [Promethearchaeota archaeon]
MKQRNQEKAETYQTHTTRTKVYVTKTAPQPTYSNKGNVSPKSRLVLILLWFFFGVLGVHYFYAGRIGMGLLWLVTGGFFGIGWIIDIISILTGTFRDSYGRPIINM